MKINLYSDFFSDTGYASHSRQFANALFKLNKELHVDTIRPDNYLRDLSSAEYEMIHSDIFPHETDVMINLPPFYSQVQAQKPKQFIGWCVWEGINIPKYWVPYLHNATHIIAPSVHTKDAILNTDPTLKNVEVIHHGVNTKLFRPIQGMKHVKFTFLANKGWARGINDRGGIQWLLKAFCDEFVNETDVRLLVKINVAYNQPQWNLFNELAAIGITPELAKNCEFIATNIRYNELPNLYAQGDCFVSPTMGDAFNLPCLEAMACGLPVITTNFGGQVDFVNNENGWLVDYSLVDVTWDMMYEGNMWAIPDYNHLRKCMREAYTNRDKTQQKGLKALQDAQNFTWDNSAKKLYDLIRI